MTITRIPFLALLLAALAAAPVQAQETPKADLQTAEVESRLDVLVASHESVSNRQRREVDSFLQRADVQQIARSRGVEMERLHAAAGAMSNSQASEVAALVATLAPVQDGNGLGTITVSAVAVIIVLLVLILVT
jgi:hypothetical protein